MRETNNAPRSPARRGTDLTGMTGEHLLELLPVGAFVCDAAGVILRYNRRAAEIWRRVPKPGQTHRDFSSTSRFFAVDGTPAGTPARRALPVAGDDAEAKDRVVALLDQFGYDVVDAGPLAEGWRFQPDTPAYGQRLEADTLREALAAAARA